jgi:Uma2 family endonuclease
MEGSIVEIPMPHPDLKLTVEDYELFPDDGRRHEVVDGDHVVTPAPTVRHQRVLLRLVVAVHAAVDQGDLGEVLFAPTDVVLSRHDVVQPDLLFVGRERSAIVSERIDGAPDLAAEVLSPASRRTDELLKRRRYEAFGVRELWVVDPELEVVRVYLRESPQRFHRPLELSAERGDRLDSTLLPGFSLELARLFGR